jgi:hypothetical protein
VAFTEKLINVQFDLKNGSFEGGGNTANISGLRTIAHIDVRAGVVQSHLDLAIYGLPLSVMNQLTTFGPNYLAQSKNGVIVEAGDAESGMSTVFVGNIYTAFVDGQSQPQVCLRVKATPGNFYNVKPQTPLSFQGPTQASTIAQKIAGYLGMTLENNGVNTVLTNPYYASDAVSMIRMLGEHAGFDWIMDRGVLAITPAGHARAGDPVLISPSTGMVGYPTFVSPNIVVKALFNPNVKYLGLIQVQSELTPACGIWKIIKLDLDLESKVPHGKWFLTAEAITASAVTPDN